MTGTLFMGQRLIEMVSNQQSGLLLSMDLQDSDAITGYKRKWPSWESNPGPLA